MCLIENSYLAVFAELNAVTVHDLAVRGFVGPTGELGERTRRLGAGIDHVLAERGEDRAALFWRAGESLLSAHDHRRMEPVLVGGLVGVASLLDTAMRGFADQVV